MDNNTHARSICSNCGAEMQPGQKFCSRCGSQASLAPVAVPKKNICSNCGNEMKEGQQFCGSCGSQASLAPVAVPKKNICSNCGAELQEGQKFCNRCGNQAGPAVASAGKAPVYQAPAVKKRSKAPWIIIISLLLVIGLAVGAWFVFFAGSSDDDDDDDRGSHGHTEATGDDDDDRGSGHSSNRGDDDDDDQVYVKDELHVSVFWYNEADVYLSTVRDELNAQLHAAGVTFDNWYANNDQAKQLVQIETAIDNGSNLLIVNVVTAGDPNTAKVILEKAGNIPVIFFNRAVGWDGSDATLLDDYDNACFIGTDSPECGHMQGKMIGEYLVANFDTVDLNGDGVISYALFKGDEGNVEAIYRTQFSVEDANAVLTAYGYPALQYFDPTASQEWQADPEGAWSARAAMDYMSTNLVIFNESNGNMIELVICNNDGMAEGAVAALQQAGYNRSGAHTIPVFGIDCTDTAKLLIADGAMTGTVRQDVDGQAVAICQTALAIAEGMDPAEALASLTDPRFSVAEDCAGKLYVAYAPYTGE